MIDELNKLLREICLELSRGDVSNFEADAKVFQIEADNTLSEIDLIKKMLGSKAEIEIIEESSLAKALDIIKDCFEYEGDEDVHPNLMYLPSEKFKRQLGELLSGFESLLCNSSKVYEFRLKAGHPFYPVFWEFAFLIKRNESNVILIGSSSD